MKFFKLKEVVLIPFLFILFFSLSVFLLGTRVKTEDIARFVEKTGVWSPLVFTVANSLTMIIAPLSGTPFFFAGYILFGKDVIVYSYFSAIISAIINFWISRRWGRGIVVKMVGEKNMDKVDQFTEEYGIKTLILLRLFQGQFHDYISYAYGLTDLRFAPYIIITALAPFPWLVLWWFFIFSRVKDIGDFTKYWLATLLPLFIVSGLFLKEFKKRHGRA